MGNTEELHQNVFENIPIIDLKTLEIDRGLAKILPEDIARKIEGIVIGKPDENTIVIAVKNPLHIYIYTIVYLMLQITNIKYIL